MTTTTATTTITRDEAEALVAIIGEDWRDEFEENALEACDGDADDAREIVSCEQERRLPVALDAIDTLSAASNWDHPEADSETFVFDSLRFYVKINADGEGRAELGTMTKWHWDLDATDEDGFDGDAWTDGDTLALFQCIFDDDTPDAVYTATDERRMAFDSFAPAAIKAIEAYCGPMDCVINETSFSIEFEGGATTFELTLVRA